MNGQRLRVDTRRVVAVFGLIIVALALGHLATQTVKYQFGIPFAYGLVDLFDMGSETNLPTFFSGFQLLVCSLVLATIGLSRRAVRDPFSRHWLALAVIFFLLAADEMAGLHELTIRPIRELAPGLATGVLYWAWVIPGSLFVLFVALAYARFVFVYLPPFPRRRTLIGGGLFLAGAIGVEMPEARHAQIHGIENLTYGLYVLLEELLEKAGILVFLSGILQHLRVAVGAFTIDPSPRPVPARASPTRIRTIA